MNKTLLFVFCSMICYNVFAQDVIIKNDKTEIKAKVLEVQENVIKYKSFDFQDGPTYNINKRDVFMIIYKNGKRETFNSTAELPKSAQVTHNDANSIKPVSQLSSTTDLVDYRPVRLLASLGKTDENVTTNFTIELSGEKRLLKNFNYLNWGVSVFYGRLESSYGWNEGWNDTYPQTVNELNTFGGRAFLSGYLPINLLWGKTEQKNKGPFPFFRAGVAMASTSGTTYITMSAGDDQTSTSVSGSNTDFDYAAGLDYKIGNGFGITVLTEKFKAFWWGVNFQFGNKK
ncbi:hypothetical protein FW774_11970 [Pedobacter sp. BS3]|uniref:hypothetical protein n=1 Tax=Pedobacter sp. BS3 TaxID=2567937 RepID=UPI0011EF0C62|nr:hypothetical protein [Pedobacter sp. BS3]TZF83015.1 hypothetical protein FW774_11970 [Pedobacter sp. BS3]